MAKGKFSQPRQPRRETDDFEALYRRTKSAQPERPIDEKTLDTTLAETKVIQEIPVSQQAAPQQPELPEEPVSFEESVFLNETADLPPTLQEGTYEEDEEEYEEEEEDEDHARKRKILVISICVAAALLLVAIITGVVLFLRANADDGLILENVTVAGVNIGGMTVEQATSAVHRATDLTYTNENMVVNLPDTTLELSPKDTGAKLDVDAAVKAAYDYGRTGTREENNKARANAAISSHTIALLPYLNLDTDYIKAQLEEYGEYFNSEYEDSSFTLEGDMPELAGDKFDENVPCQALILNPGMPGRNLDMDKVYNDVLDAYSLNIFEVQTDLTELEKTPEELDLDAIYEALTVEPVDAAMNMETFEVTRETYGYSFDLEKAKELLSETEYGTTISVPMEYVIPDVLAEDLEGKLFRDVLGAYETNHSNDSNRTHNLKLACEALDGLILNPGDTLDYNETLGKRTEEAGYKPAGAINGGESTTEVGGGICQVSSTLYYCTLIADLEIVDRRSHSLVSSYMPMGLDATVSWGGPEFRFKNNTNYPIMIEAEVSDGKVKIQLLGTDEKDYYVEMETKIVEVLSPQTEEKHYAANNAEGYHDGQVLQNGVTGYTVYSYKVKYNKTTNELISRDYEATSNYVRKNKIVVVIDAPETEPTEAPTEAPATEAIQATTEATQATADPVQNTEAAPAAEPEPTTAATEAPAA